MAAKRAGVGARAKGPAGGRAGRTSSRAAGPAEGPRAAGPTSERSAPGARAPGKAGRRPGGEERGRRALADVMSALAAAGSAQTRKTYLRHGATEPLYGVSFAALKTLVKQLGVDHALALALWDTGNFDARNLAVKVADPARMSADDLDRWASCEGARMCSNYVAWLAAEGGQGLARATAWLAAPDPVARAAGWSLVGALALLDEGVPDAWFVQRLGELERTIHEVPDAQRVAMNQALIAIGCRSAALRRSASAAAKRAGKVEVDHGDTACKTPDALASIDKAWAHSTSKGFASPAAHERSRKSMRVRC